MKRTKGKNAQPFHLRWGLSREWTVEESERCSHATTWLVGAGNTIMRSERHTESVSMLGELRDLLLPVAALQFYGSVEENTAEISSVTMTIEIVKRNYPRWEKVHLELEKIAADLKERTTQLAEAEKILASKGWKFDTGTRKVSRKAKGHRGKDLLKECVWAIYTAKHQEKGNNIYTRQKIAETLAPFVDAKELRTDNKAPLPPIYNAIYKGENPR